MESGTTLTTSALESFRDELTDLWGDLERLVIAVDDDIDARDWKVDPLSGEIQDGCVWGRGAVDMKDFDAMLLSVVRARARAGAVPDRPVVLAFTADEEAGGHKGAEVLVREHADHLDGVVHSIGFAPQEAMGEGFPEVAWEHATIARQILRGRPAAVTRATLDAPCSRQAE